MRISAKLKIGLGLVVVFIAGAIFGSWAHAQYTKRVFIKSLDHTAWAATVLKGLDEELHLSPEQKQQAKVMLDETVHEVTRTFTHLGEELVQLHLRIQSILTPEQRAKNAESFEKFRRELKRCQITLPNETDLTNSLPVGK